MVSSEGVAPAERSEDNQIQQLPIDNEPRSLSPHVPNEKSSEEAGHVTCELDHVTTSEPDHVTTSESGQVTNKPDHVTADESSRNDNTTPSESRDVLTDLPAVTHNSLKGKRLRSETESRGVRFMSFKGRKRSHTLHEGVSTIKEKEEDEEVSVSQRIQSFNYTCSVHS